MSAEDEIREIERLLRQAQEEQVKIDEGMTKLRAIHGLEWPPDDNPPEQSA